MANEIKNNVNLDNIFNSYFLKIVVFLSISSGLFWLIGLVLDTIFNDNIVLNLLISISGALIILVVITYKKPNILKLPDASALGEIYLLLILYCLAGYLLLIPVIGAGAYVFVQYYGNPNASDSGIGITLLAIWLPIWWAPSIGSFWTWRKLKNKYAS